MGPTSPILDFEFSFGIGWRKPNPRRTRREYLPPKETIARVIDDNRLSTVEVDHGDIATPAGYLQHSLAHSNASPLVGRVGWGVAFDTAIDSHLGETNQLVQPSIGNDHVVIEQHQVFAVPAATLD